MPDVDGRELARRFTGLWPALRVLFVSGYAQQFAVEGSSLEPGVAFLQKPFQPSDFVLALRRLLTTAPGSAPR